MLQWVDTVRYLGVHFVQAKYFKCSFDYAKRAFHLAANSIFGKIGIELLRKKPLSNLLKANVYQFHYTVLKHTQSKKRISGH